MRRILPFTLLVLCALAAGCAGGGDGAGGSGGTRGPRVTELEARDADTLSGPSRTGPTTLESFPPDTRAFMEDGLRCFSRGDPAWPEVRARWLSLGDRESRFLVSAMWAALLRAQQLAASELVERARHELALIGEPSVPLLAAVITGDRAYSLRDEVEQADVEVRIDDLARNEASEILTIVGRPAVPALADAAAGAETKSGARFALKALGNMGDGGGPLAARTLADWARSKDWVLRVEAVQGMRTRTDPVTRDALIEALSDDETLVREKAADALAQRREEAALPALRQMSAWAQENGLLREASHHGRAVKAIEAGR